MSRRPSLSRMLRRLWRNRVAGMSTLATLALPAVIGSAGLAFDLNRGYEQRVINQRAADMAALAAAMAFEDVEDTSILTPTARDIVRANGIADVAVEAALIENFPAEDQRAVRVRVTRPLPFTLARVVGLSGGFSVTAEATASLNNKPPAAPCYLALNPGPAAFSMTGNASIDAPNCSVAAVGTIKAGGVLLNAHDVISGGADIVVGSGTLSAETVRFAGSLVKASKQSNVPPPDRWVAKPTTLIDPWAASSELSRAKDLLGTYTAPPTLTNPTTPAGTNWSFVASPSAPVSAYRVGNTTEFIVPPGNYTINRLYIEKDVKVTFQSGSRITVRDGVAIGQSANVRFGDVDLYVNGGFDTGSSGVTIGNGALWIGSGAVRFQGVSAKGDGDVIINSTLAATGLLLTMGAGQHHFGAVAVSGGGVRLGNGDFSAVAGVMVEGGGELAIGNGNIRIGSGGDKLAISLKGSTRFIMGDGPFSANGGIDTAGGSRLIFGKTANYYINGTMRVSGAVLFGAGRYTVAGNLLNDGPGGAVWPYTSSLTGQTYGTMLEGENVSGYAVAGIDVTFIVGGYLSLAGGVTTKLQAPMTSVPGAGIAGMLIAGFSTTGSTWTGNTSSVYGGTLYLPNSLLKMSGGSSTGSEARCLTVIADTIEMTGSSTSKSACKAPADVIDEGSGSIRLVR